MSKKKREVVPEKPVAWLHGEVKTPPFSLKARLECGLLLGRLQYGEKLTMPASRPMPNIGKRCHELRVVDDENTWRIVYRTDTDAIVIADVFKKKTNTTPKETIEKCRKRLAGYDEAIKDEKRQKKKA